LAGFTPDAFVIDEVKRPFIDQLNRAKPSFDTGSFVQQFCLGPVVMRSCLETLVVLNDRKTTSMNWDALERGIDKEDIKWTRESLEHLHRRLCQQRMEDKVKLSKIPR
jgi:hypothetical protein